MTETKLAPAQPTYVLRGHAAPVHCVQFVNSNAHLITGDAEGWVVIWDVTTKRPLSVWRAHDEALLATAAWAPDRIITHGRDHRICVWQWRADDSLSTVLPVHDASSHRPCPWLLHLLHVNTLNFCSFSYCLQPCDPQAGPSSVLLAVPGALNSDGVGTRT